MKWVKQAFDHTVPTILRNFPWLIRGVHSLQTVLYQRNRLLRQKVDVILCNSAKATTESIVVLDAGCGDGHYFLRALRMGVSHLIALDRNEGWLSFLRGYIGRFSIQQNTQVDFHCENLDQEFLVHELASVDLIFCFAVLPYVKDLNHTMKQFSRVAKDGARLLIYVPVNFTIELSMYQWMFQRFNHSEHAQNRQKVLVPSDVFATALVNGFEVSEVVYAYGKWGRVGHEIWSMTTMLLGSKGLHWNVLGLTAVSVTFPLLLILTMIDRLDVPKTGNGMYCEFLRVNRI